MKISLKAARVNANLTQDEASKMIGITKRTLQNYETGITAPNIKTVRKIEDAYNIHSDDIIFFAN